jgi:hypothetical protein
MGWASLLFAVGGFAVGFGCGVIIRRLSIFLLFVACKQSRSLFTSGLLMAYLLVPMAAMLVAFAGTAWLTTWLAKHFV